MWNCAVTRLLSWLHPPSQWLAFQPHQSPSHCLRAVLTHPFPDFAVPSAVKTLPCLVGLKNSYSSCNTQLRSFSVKASLTAFPTLPRMTTPLYLAYPECYSSACTCLCVTFVYCTHVITYTALDCSAFLPWPSPWLQCQPPEVRH